VDAGHAVGIGVNVGVGGKTGRVRVRADACWRVVDPSSHRVALCASVGGLQADCGGHEVTPALSHASGLQGSEAVAVGRSSGESVREATMYVSWVV
jgi:hypothetical protein